MKWKLTCFQLGGADPDDAAGRDEARHAAAAAHARGRAVQIACIETRVESANGFST